jgi:hypothetical protein
MFIKRLYDCFVVLLLDSVAVQGLHKWIAAEGRLVCLVTTSRLCCFIRRCTCGMNITTLVEAAGEGIQCTCAQKGCSWRAAQVMIAAHGRSKSLVCV